MFSIFPPPLPYDNNINHKLPKSNTFIVIWQFYFDFIAIWPYPINKKGVLSMEFGEKLKELRLSKGLGVNQLALKSGVSASQISRFENGERKDPTFETVKKLSQALGVSTSYFDDRKKDERDTDNLLIATHVDDGLNEQQKKEVQDFIEFIKMRDHNKK